MTRFWPIVALCCFFFGAPRLGHAQEVRVSDMNCDLYYNPSHTVNLRHVIALIQEAGFPKQWLVIIACNDRDWKRIQNGARLSPYHEKTAFTSLKKKTTVVNLKVFDSAANMGYLPMNVLHHEVGHIRCQCADEEEAEKQGQSTKKR